MTENLFLLGYRGTGKSTVARLLAERLGLPACDSDDEIERRAGCTIAEIFAARGEAPFRDLEEQVVDELTQRTGVVLALGGGAILRETTRDRLLARGVPIWLRASAETLWERIRGDVTTAERRPNLTAQGGLAEIAQLLAAREPLYRAATRLTIDTEGKTPPQVAEEIVNALAMRGVARW